MLEKYQFLEDLTPEQKERTREWVIKVYKEIEYLK